MFYCAENFKFFTFKNKFYNKVHLNKPDFLLAFSGDIQLCLL